MGGVREDELCDARARLDFYRVVHFQQSFAPSFVAGVPHRRIEHTGVAKERGPGVQKADVVLGDNYALGVPHDVPARVEVVDALLVSVKFLALADRLAAALDAARFDLLED